MGLFHGTSRIGHGLEHFGVGGGVFQGLPLELDGGERPVDLRQLLLVALLPLEGLQSRWWGQKVGGLKRYIINHHLTHDCFSGAMLWLGWGRKNRM